ncbi:hypothetical protein MKX01_004758 [Papaver californicum]|nr:hypothetical protein MKX01_004758 [Papaver californicum]
MITDVSPIVHKITGIIRAQDVKVSFEERLERSGFLFDSDIVDKVLKRCFKVGHLAYRFFNWVKLQNGYHHTTSTYNTMLYIAGEAKEFGLVDKLVKEMEMELCSKDIKTWTILISSYGKVNMIGRCLHVFENMRKSGCEPDGRTYKLIFLNCLSRSGNVSAVRLIGNDMVYVSQIPEQIVHSCILRCFCISGRIQEAIELLHELKSKNITLDPTHVEILVKGLCNTGRITDALEIIEIMKQNQFVDGKAYGIVITGILKRESGHLPVVSTYTELIQHLFRSNEYKRACKLYREMLENGVEPDIVAFTVLITGQVQHNHCNDYFHDHHNHKLTDKALELLSGTRSSKMNISGEMFHLVISSSERKGAKKTAEKVKQIWRAIYSQENDSVYLPTNHQSLDVATNTVVDIFHPTEFCCSLKPTQLHPLREKVLMEPLCRVYSDYDFQENSFVLQIYRILSSSMDWRSMQEALEKHTTRFTPELVLDVLHHCQHYGNIFTIVAGRVDEALAKVDKMKEEGISPTVHVYTSLIVHLFKKKQIGKALEFFKKMGEDGCEPTIVTFSALIRGYMNTEILKGPIPDFKTYSMFMTCLCEIGRSEEALQLLYEMSSIPLTFCTVYYGLNREGKNDLAHTVLQRKWDLMNKRKLLS